jgi:signal peptidase I
VAAGRAAIERARRAGRRVRHLWPVAVLVALVATWALAAEPLRISSTSMEPSLRSGEHVLVEKVSYRLHPPRRDDLIVFRPPDGGGLAVKRVVAVAGDTVGLEDGVLVVNGVSVRESYVDHRTIDSVYFGPETVPDDAIFVMGDNRGPSIDSRSYGSVDVDAVVGRIIWHP